MRDADKEEYFLANNIHVENANRCVYSIITQYNALVTAVKKYNGQGAKHEAYTLKCVEPTYTMYSRTRQNNTTRISDTGATGSIYNANPPIILKF